MGLTLPKAKDLSHLVDSRIGVPNANLSERIVNTQASDWDYGAPLSWNNGVFSYADGALGDFRQDIDTYAGEKLLIKFTISNSESPFAYLTIHIANQAVVNYSYFENGTHYAVITVPPPNLGVYQIRFYCNATGKAFDISDMSATGWDGEELVPDPDVGFVANSVDTWSVYGTNTKEQDGNAVKISYAGGSPSSLGGFVRLRTAQNSVHNNNQIGSKMRLVTRAKVAAGANVTLRAFSGGSFTESYSVTSTEYETFIFDFEVETDASNVYLTLGNMDTALEQISVEIVSYQKITGLVAAYNMIPSPEGVLVDISGNGYNGTIVNTSVDSNGMEFSRINLSHVDLGQQFSLGKQITWAARFMLPKLPPSSGSFLAAYNGGDRFAVWILSTGTIRTSFYDGTYTRLIESDINISAGVWYDIVINLVEAGGSTMYINGVAQYQTSGADLSMSNFDLICTRSRTLDGTDAVIDDIRIFNYSLSEAEAIDYHNSFQKLTKRGNFSDHPVGSTI
jgi:hypothetical protein